MKSCAGGRSSMRPETPQLATLSAMIARDLEAIERLHSEFKPLEPSLNEAAPAYRDMAAIAYTLHNIYGALENMFEQISRTFENHVTDPAQWHRELLSKMFLEIPTVRPAVLPASLRAFLNDLRGFRHVFRHAYEFELDAEKLRLLVRERTESRATLSAALSDFRQYLLRDIGGYWLPLLHKSRCSQTITLAPDGSEPVDDHGDRRCIGARCRCRINNWLSE